MASEEGQLRNISETDPRYIETRERRKATTEYGRIFGEGINFVESERERICILEERAQALIDQRDKKRIVPLLQSTRRKLTEEIRNIQSTKDSIIDKAEAEALLKKDFIDFAERFKRFMRSGLRVTSDQIFQHIIKRIDALGLGMSINEFLVQLEKGTISMDKVYAIAKKHFEQCREEERQLEVLKDSVIKQLKDRVHTAVADGSLPPSAAANLHRLDHMRVLYIDRLTAMMPLETAHSASQGIIRVYSESVSAENSVTLAHVLMHEMIHEIAGSSLTLFMLSMRTEQPLYIERRVRTGVFSGVTTYNGDWLNEALTERLAKRFSGEAEYPAYTRENALLEILLSLDVSGGVFSELSAYDAYFENFQQTGETKINPAETNYRRLVDALNEVYKVKWQEIVERFGQRVNVDMSAFIQEEEQRPTEQKGTLGWIRLQKLIEFSNTR